MKSDRKRIYKSWMGDIYDNGIICIVAHNIKEAKSFAMSFWDWDEYIDVRIKWIKEVSSDKLKEIQVGEIDQKDGYDLGVYGTPTGNCPKCGEYNEPTPYAPKCTKCKEDILDTLYNDMY